MAHWLSGVVVAVSGCVSGIFVVCANAWMNTPAGFRMLDGKPVDIDPYGAMFNPAAFQQTLHMTIAAYLAVAFAAAGIHAFMLLRHPDSAFHRRAIAILLPIAAVTALIQPLSGDLSGKNVAQYQPAKMAAIEGHWETSRRAPIRLFGNIDEEKEQTTGGIPIPGALSFLAFGDFDAEVKGLKEFSREDRPPVTIVRNAFLVMVLSGMTLAAVGVLGLFLWLRGRRVPTSRWYLRLLVAVSPLGLLAIEAGWIVTEVGRQPWIVYGIMRTRDAVTPMPGLMVPLVTIACLYLFLGVVVIALLRQQVFAAPRMTERDDA
jgi:cytochrome d ubiquinol oxidase subunit I